MTKILPSEWATQRLVQLTFPHSGTDWAYMIEEVTECFVRIACEIALRESLLIVTPDPKRIRALLNSKANMSNIQIAKVNSNDTWARDHGGITVFENEIGKIYDFTFNGWGMKFAANHDNQITKQLFEQGFFKDYQYTNQKKIVLEGGSFESDGKGILLTTEKCLLSINRNNLEKGELEILLKEMFGLQKILWLKSGYLAGDDTDSHIDTLARICPNNTIAYVKCNNPDDEHFDELNKMESELKSFKTIENKPFQLLALPMADPIFDENNERLPATYANYLILNGAVLVPTYHSDNDKIAIAQIQQAFPEREIIGIDCRALIKQHGSLHCVTMQYAKMSS